MTREDVDAKLAELGLSGGGDGRKKRGTVIFDIEPHRMWSISEPVLYAIQYSEFCELFFSPIIIYSTLL